MSQTAVVVQGIVRADGTLELAEKLDVPAGRVQVVIQPLPDLSKDPFWQRMEAIWAGQAGRGHVPRTKDQIDAEVQGMRDEMEQEFQATERLQEQCRMAREEPGRDREASE